MNLLKFLIFDGILLLVSIPIVVILQSKNDKSIFFRLSNGNQLDDKALSSTPDFLEILDLESLAKQKGSGIEFDSLVGLWKFTSVWKQNIDKENLFVSALLRLFSASLELRKRETDNESLQYEITNSIKFGLLSLRFKGFAALKGNQPLLSFYFEQIVFKISEKCFSKNLDIPEEKNWPFFSLIALNESPDFLIARGRGGGLAVWHKE